jgi:hypothetical protein
MRPLWKLGIRAHPLAPFPQSFPLQLLFQPRSLVGVIEIVKVVIHAHGSLPMTVSGRRAALLNIVGHRNDQPYFKSCRRLASLSSSAENTPLPEVDGGIGVRSRSGSGVFIN